MSEAEKTFMNDKLFLRSSTALASDHSLSLVGVFVFVLTFPQHDADLPFTEVDLD